MKTALLLITIFFLATMRRNRQNRLLCPFPFLEVFVNGYDITPLAFFISIVWFLSSLKKPDTTEQKQSKMKALKILLFLPLSISNISAQLPGPDTLFSALRQYHTEAAAVQLERLKVKSKTDWLHWMPSVGVTLGKPTIGFSLAQVSANIERKAERKAEIAAILRGANLAFQTDSFTLVSLISKLEILKKSMLWLESIERIDNEKFELDREKYERTEITPSQWLDIKATHLRQGEAYFRRREEIQILETEIRKTAKF